MAQQNTAMEAAQNAAEITVMPYDSETHLLACAPSAGPAPDAVQVWADHHDDVLITALGEARGQQQYRVEVVA